MPHSPDAPTVPRPSSHSHTRPSPSLLAAPATIISPPSPTDVFHHSSFSVRPPSGEEGYVSDEAVAMDSPDEDNGGTPAPQLAHTLASSPDSSRLLASPESNRLMASPESNRLLASPALDPQALISTQLSYSPQMESAHLGLSASPTGSHASLTRSPSPSSPQFRPRGLHHRRTSSTHRVRETVDGQQSNTADGNRMVNQYKIGKALGQGAYAKVELAVDVETGTEYAIKEFSKSRLHHQSLQEKNRLSSRSIRRVGPRGRGAALRGRGGAAGRPEGQSPAPDQGQSQGALGLMQSDESTPAVGTKTEEEDPLALIRREIAVMKKLDHPNLVHLYEAISVPTADALFLVLEYLPGGALMSVKVGISPEDATPPFDLESAREYFRQLCLGLEYLHENQVIHRDIKPDNVLLSRDRRYVKLCDFGVSEMFAETDRVKKSGGSPAFQSPETFQSSIEDLHGKAVDIWALGVTLYCMLSGTLPFDYSNAFELYTAVMTKEPYMPQAWAPDMKDIVSRMLCKNPDERIVMEELREHTWTTKDGELPMIDTEDNLYELGKHVEEPTQEELKDAIGTMRGIFHMVRAVHKMRRLHLGRQQTQGGPSPNVSAAASMASGSMDSYLSNDQLTSNTSVSDDADEAAQAERQRFKDLAGEEVTSPKEMSLALPGEDDGLSGKDEGEETGSGEGSGDGERASPTETARQGSNPFDRLRMLDTKLLGLQSRSASGSGARGEEGEGESQGMGLVMDSPSSGGMGLAVDSPTSDDAQTERVGSGSSR
ncbi:hypothetical protein IAT38_005630 [Cryptococcus sp. DSM 104549]